MGTDGHLCCTRLCSGEQINHSLTSLKIKPLAEGIWAFLHGRGFRDLHILCLTIASPSKSLSRSGATQYLK
jgi:hypothetical protein